MPDLLASNRRRRIFGVRVWLALMFAGVGILSGASVYVFVSGQSESAAEERSDEIALGRTLQLARRLGSQPDANARRIVASFRNEAFAAWAFDDAGELVTPRSSLGVSLESVEGGNLAVGRALASVRVVEKVEAEDDATIVALPIFRDNELDGAVLSRATRPLEVRSALQAIRGERLRGLAFAVVAAALLGALVATGITGRVRRLARDAGRLAAGRLTTPVAVRGRDEIGELGRALDSMRLALRDSFDALSSERDRLSAVFEGMSDAVVVVGRWGDVRFANPAAAPLIFDGHLSDRFDPWVRRAVHHGSAQNDALQVGDHVYGLTARDLPAEEAVLLVVRDRTAEMRREVAEREFVSNAAHELRNPIAGISSAIEVLRSGAKDDPEAREHFLRRLEDDTDRMRRLTQALLTLARVEAIGEGEAEVVGVELAAREAAEFVEAPPGVDFQIDVAPELTAKADPILLRQVLVGLLSNAFKHTSAPGAVTLRARLEGDGDVLIEVADTGSGIAPEERERVFERFYRGTGTLEKEGFGLGLSIAKRMVDVMGGEIGVDSSEGDGSTFWIRLEVAEANTGQMA